MHPRCFLLLCLLLLSRPLTAQDHPVYRTSRSGDGVTLGAGLGLSLSAHLREFNMQTPDAAVFAGLDPRSIHPIDRPAVYNWSPTAARFSDAMVLGSGFASLGMLLADGPSRRSAGTILLMASEAFLIVDGLGFHVRTTVRRLRPLAYNPDVALEEKQRRGVRQSFYSMHTCYVASAGFFMAKVYHDLHPGSRWRYAVWGGAGALSLGTAWLRVKSGKHFPTDVVAGLAAGALVGVLVPELHRRRAGVPGERALRLEIGPAREIGGLRLGLVF